MTHFRTIRCMLVIAVLAILTTGLLAQNKPATAAHKSTPAPAAATNPEMHGKQSLTAAATTDEGYIIGIEDELQISVWHEPELSLGVVVRPDGKITMPLLDDIYVTGLSTKQLQAMLAEKLKPYVTEPQVTIIVRGIHSRKVFLAGQVAHPGSFQLIGTKTLLELLVEAGGVGPFAKADSIYILRKNASGQQQKLPFSYKKALKGEAPNVELIPGDIVVVP